MGRHFRSGLHREWVAARLGLALGVAFGGCFLTGLMSHLAQHPALGFRWPSSPAWLFALTQGVHTATGLAVVPLLVAKLYVVYPQLFTWPPARDVAHAVERGALLLLVGGSIFQLATGVMNIERWYAWGFYFTTAHYWTA